MKDKVLSTNAVVLAIPCGGVPVAFEVATELNLPLDVIIAKDFGFGSICEDERLYLTDQVGDDDWEIIREVKHELRRRVMIYRKGRLLPDLRNKEIVLVDDGLESGVTALSAARFLKEEGASRVTLAVPVSAPTDYSILRKYIDEIVCPFSPNNFLDLIQWYQNFSPISDAEVTKILIENQAREVGQRNLPFHF